MRHRAGYRKLNRFPSHRKMMLRNLLTSLIIHERIVTTEARAKEVRRLADRVITWAKKDTLHDWRKVYSLLLSKEAGKHLEEIKDRFEGRDGGYTRIIPLGERRGDGSFQVIIELIKE
ncbi:MAG: 50S ribosomal protein L17 [Caldiserica bacterium]|nr:MAG: 50S ribosomal protein L17 [Caldisericota bacterium]HDH63471.1 50S ribosomal protein L17 [Bacillota bacterium]